MKATNKTVLKTIALPLIGGVMVVLGLSSAHAAKFGVRVVGDDGQPVVGAAVCIGTHGNYKQFAALFTSSTGDVIVEVPPVPLLVTVSKTRFAGVRMSEPARRFNLVKEVKLSDGVPGPRCRAGSSMASEDAQSQTQLQISDVQVSEGVYSVALVADFVGQPNHYRLSKTSSFNDAKWKSLKGPINIENNLLGSNAVFLQVRRYKTNSGAAIEARSNVVKVNLEGF